MKPCVDGFLAGCRPFVGVDATALNGKYTGQLASTTSVDGHNWLYHLAFGIFYSETEDNWKWFMQQLHRAIGTPDGLVICTDACKGLGTTVGAVFSQAEYRECMRHMYSNFMKHYQGDVFTDHLYPAARSYTEELFKWHMKKIAEFAPDAIDYLDEHHNKIWYRCGFYEKSKCAIKELNTISINLKLVKVVRSDEDFAEVTLLDDWNNQKRHTVDLAHNSCSYREW